MIGAFGTFAYLVFVGWYWRNQLSSIFELAPNELGDFLAGVFAPLAFLWLVLGFLQQGLELRNSANALWLQGEELKNSVEQQRDLVNVTREQLAFESKLLAQQQSEVARNSRPILKLVQAGSSGSANGTRLYRFQLFNHGKPCTDIRLERDGKQLISRPALGTGQHLEFNQTIEHDSVEEFSLTVHFLDSRLLDGTANFLISKEKSAFSITEEVARSYSKATAFVRPSQAA